MVSHFFRPCNLSTHIRRTRTFCHEQCDFLLFQKNMVECEIFSSGLCNCATWYIWKFGEENSVSFFFHCENYVNKLRVSAKRSGSVENLINLRTPLTKTCTGWISLNAFQKKKEKSLRRALQSETFLTGETKFHLAMLLTSAPSDDSVVIRPLWCAAALWSINFRVAFSSWLPF